MWSPAGAARQEPLVAPQTAVVPKRRNRRPSRYPAHRAPTVAGRPPRQGRPATVQEAPRYPLTRGPAHRPAGFTIQRVEHNAEHPHCPGLVEWGVAVAALRRLHAGRAAPAALAVADG